jgi:hypothetical protein
LKFLKNLGIQNVHPSILPFDQPSSDWKEQFNNEFASYRTIVENVISKIKDWSICGDIYRVQDISMNYNEIGILHHKIWSTSAALVNRYIGPLRNYNF